MHESINATAGGEVLRLQKVRLRGPTPSSGSVHRFPQAQGAAADGRNSRTGSAILRAVAPTVKPVSFELGGKNAAIVFADCDFDEAVHGLTDAVFLNTGQVCLCAERVYVERKIMDRFVAALKQKAEALQLGWPMDQSTTTGPLISKEHRAKVLAYFQLARQEGATVVTGGGVPEFNDGRDGGFYVQPTIFTGLPESARCVKEEIFGPVCHIAAFDTEEEAIAKANDTQYGLASYFYSRDLGRVWRVAEALEYGMVGVNTGMITTEVAPFGGVKQSGLGREGSKYGIDEYVEVKYVCLGGI